MGTETKPLPRKNVLPSRLYDSFFINEYGKLETLRAARYDTSFSVVLVDPGEGAGPRSEAFVKLSTAVVEGLRSCDVCGVNSEGQILAILPETDYFGALMAIRKLSSAAEELQGAGLSHATFPRDARGFGELTRTAAKRLEERKRSIWTEQGFEKKLFWEIIGEITNSPIKDVENTTFDLGSGYELPGNFIDEINSAITGEMIASPQTKGILLVSGRDFTAARYLRRLDEAGKNNSKVYVVSNCEDLVWDVKSVAAICLDDHRLKETFFTFYLSEDSAYALMGREHWGGTFSCFHTSDAYLVEGLINKFQNEYTLQEQL